MRRSSFEFRQRKITEYIVNHLWWDPVLNSDRKITEYIVGEGLMHFKMIIILECVLLLNIATNVNKHMKK